MMVAVYLVSRPKLNSALGRHYGLAVQDLRTRRMRVVDLQHDSRRRVLTPDQFAGGRELVWQGPMVGAAALESLRRLKAVLSQPRLTYDFLKRNCEHFARYVFQGQARSPQIEFGLIVAGAILLLIALRAK